MLRNPLATSPMLRSTKHSSELWVLRPANTGIMAAQHNSDGDVDVLLCDPSHPEQAVAYEMKIIKFGRSALQPGV